MWERLKSFWGSRAPGDLDEAGEADERSAGEAGGAGEAAVAEAPARAPAREAAPSPATSELRAIDEALAAGDLGLALGRVRDLLVAMPTAPDVMDRAARVLETAGEGELAHQFRVARGGRDGAGYLTLARSFLVMDDAELAAALARAALGRSGPDDAAALGVVADALARQGEHDEVLGLLERLEGRFSDAALLDRYAVSALLAGDRARYDRVAAAVAADPDAAWVARAAARAGAFGPDEDRPLRHTLFVQYGAALLDADEIVRGAPLGPARLMRVLDRARVACELVPSVGDRIAYVSPRGEVFARWMAGAVDGTAVPMSARIPGARVLVVVVDDDDMATLVGHRAFHEGPLVILQVVKDPRRAELPAPDLIGLLGEDVVLPLEGVEAERAAERVPPSLLAAELARAASGAEYDSGAAEVGPWLEERLTMLSLVEAIGPDERLAWLADLPSWLRK